MPDDDLDRLLAAYLDDTLDATETACFYYRLRSDTEARRLLLAASVQASALPRLGLEVATRTPRPVAQHSSRWWWMSVVAAAAVLLLVVGGWLPPMHTSPTVAGVVVERDGQPGAAPMLGDLLINETGPLVVRWLDEDTRIDLAPGSGLRIIGWGVNKRLQLESGTLRATVARQLSEGGLQIGTPHGRVDVVGTSFTIEVQEQVSRVAVTHGTVRVGAGNAPTSVPIPAGYAVEVTLTTVSAPGPVADLPAAPALVPSAPTMAPARVHLTAADFSTGGEGEVVAGVVRAVAVDHVRRLTTPLRRPDGHVRLDDGISVRLHLTIDQPTTLALLLVCDQPSGGAWWIGNLQAERRIPAGTQEVVFTRSDLRLATGALPPQGSRVVAVSVMCWGPPADLRLEWLEFSQ